MALQANTLFEDKFVWAGFECPLLCWSKMNKSVDESLDGRKSDLGKLNRWLKGCYFCLLKWQQASWYKSLGDCLKANHMGNHILWQNSPKPTCLGFKVVTHWLFLLIFTLWNTWCDECKWTATYFQLHLLWFGSLPFKFCFKWKGPIHICVYFVTTPEHFQVCNEKW